MGGVREEKKATKGEEKAANGQRPGRKGCRKGCEKRWWHNMTGGDTTQASDAMLHLGGSLALLHEDPSLLTMWTPPQIELVLDGSN
jgi:hypothetical protein